MGSTQHRQASSQRSRQVDSAGMELASVLTCPECGHAEQLVMPIAACVFFHRCDNCHVLLTPKPGDCCVFCTYGSVRCPSMQDGTMDCCTRLEGAEQSHLRTPDDDAR